MRLYKLSELEANELVIHICQKCYYRTPIPPKLSPDSCKSEPPLFPIKHEINDGYCDKCNVECWEKIISDNDCI